MTAAIALRHIYSMASWSPRQSDPLTVSYMCQRQSSSPMLPSAAEMPPCAATVWLRVGNTLVTQAVERPASASPNVARRPAPPAPTTTTSQLCSMKRYSVLAIAASLADVQDREHGAAAEQHVRKAQRQQQRNLHALGVHIVLRDLRRAEIGMPGQHCDQQDRQKAVERRSQPGADHAVVERGQP